MSTSVRFTKILTAVAIDRFRRRLQRPLPVAQEGDDRSRSPTTEPPKPIEAPAPSGDARRRRRRPWRPRRPSSRSPSRTTTTGRAPPDALATARKLLDDKQYDKALKLASIAVKRMPKRSGAWNTLGRVQLQMGKRKDAIESFEKAVDLNPKNSYARNNLGLALIYDKRFEEAADALEQAVELEPVEAYMWNNLGMAYEQLDRLDDARVAYGNAVEMESDLAKEAWPASRASSR